MQTSLTSQTSNLEHIISVITKPIIGEICHQVTFSYGDELRLDFGEMTAYKHPKLKQLKQGKWRLATKATPWSVFQNLEALMVSSEVETSDNVEKIKKKVEVLQGLAIQKIELIEEEALGVSTLSLLFEKNYKLVLFSTLPRTSDLPDWELIMPTDQILTVGGNSLWECKSIHSKV